jgi:acetoacetyl-CoA synthetase
MGVREPDLAGYAGAEVLFRPSPEEIASSQMTAFTEALRAHTRESLDDYAALHAFSVRDYRTFWRFFIDWAHGFDHAGDPEPVCIGDACEHAVFFPQLELNYADNLLNLAVAPADAPALTACHADGTRVRLTRGELRERVMRLAAALEALGLQRGERVAAVMRNDESAVIVALAVTAIGATLSTASPEMGVEGLLDRFGQVAPKLLFAHTAAPSSTGAANAQDAQDAMLATLVASLDTVQAVIGLDERPLTCTLRVPFHACRQLMEVADAARFAWRRFPFNHPLFIMFSSGTTGKPKCIVHGAGGALVEHLKEHRLHSDLRVGDKLYFHTSCAWMMWNWQLSALASGVEIVTYDGPLTGVDTLWKLVADERVSVFGTSPAYLKMGSEAGLVPRERFDLTALRAMMSTGAVLFDAQFRWIAENVKPLRVQSISGGTDILGCFVLGNPNLPVYTGEAQCKSLGLAVDAWNDGAPAKGIGELVCTNPFPSRPLGFFGDADGSRFHAAYFAAHAGVWTHGDRIEFSAQGSARLHGRSDGVLNVRGINVGPGEVYRVLSDIAGIREAMVVEQRIPDAAQKNAYERRVVLLVVLERGVELTGALTARVRRELARRASRAHVPDVVLAVDALPLTHSGKLSDSAVRNAVNGLPVGNTAALRNPECLDAIRAHPGLDVAAMRAGHAPLPPPGDSVEALEAWLTLLWERLFGFGPIARDDNFLDLGGDSLLGAALVSEVEEATKSGVTLATLMLAPTIARLAAAIRGGVAQTGSRIIVPLRAGDGAPVFWIHSLAGTVMECLGVLGAMNSRRPFYGVHAKGLDGDEAPLANVAQMAALYIDEIRRVQPHGPYTLVGYSFGGLVAFEVARELHRRGERIERLCLLDTYVHAHCLPWLDWVGYEAQFIARHWRMLRAVKAAERRRYLAAKVVGAFDKIRLRAGRLALRPVQDIAHLPSAHQRMREAMRVAMTTYRPGRYDAGPIHYVRAALPLGDLCNPMPVWRRVARRGLDVTPARGSHIDMILEQHAASLAATLDRLLAGESSSTERRGDRDAVPGSEGIWVNI